MLLQFTDCYNFDFTFTKGGWRSTFSSRKGDGQLPSFTILSFPLFLHFWSGQDTKELFKSCCVIKEPAVVLHCVKQWISTALSTAAGSVY